MDAPWRFAACDAPRVAFDCSTCQSGGAIAGLHDKAPFVHADAGVDYAHLPLDPDTETEESRRRREIMVASLCINGVLESPPAIEAFRRVPRHLFVEPELTPLAYEDLALPTLAGQTISEPTVVAIMTEALSLAGKERVLEIGTGSGYQSAILSHLAKEVLTVERIPELARRAARRLSGLGRKNVQVRLGDGSKGWPELAPFDRIILTAAARSIPERLLAQLADGGVLVAPVGRDASSQQLIRVLRLGDEISVSELGPVVFVPLVMPETPRRELWS